MAFGSAGPNGAPKANGMYDVLLSWNGGIPAGGHAVVVVKVNTVVYETINPAAASGSVVVPAQNQGDVVGFTYNSYTTSGTVWDTGGASWAEPYLPPAAPNTPTNLQGVDTNTAVALTWDETGTGITGYEVSRSINGAAYTVLGTTAPKSYTDTAPGATRPLAYRVRAYVTGQGGTTYSAGYATVVVNPRLDSVGVLLG